MEHHTYTATKRHITTFGAISKTNIISDPRLVENIQRDYPPLSATSQMAT